MALCRPRSPRLPEWPGGKALARCRRRPESLRQSRSYGPVQRVSDRIDWVGRRAIVFVALKYVENETGHKLQLVLRLRVHRQDGIRQVPVRITGPGGRFCFGQREVSVVSDDETSVLVEHQSSVAEQNLRFIAH